jgi:hypothetical protein
MVRAFNPAHVIEYNLRHVSGASTPGHRWQHSTFDTVALDGEQHCARVLLGFFPRFLTPADGLW